MWEPWCPPNRPPLPSLLGHSGWVGLYVKRMFSPPPPACRGPASAPCPLEAVRALSLEGLLCPPLASPVYPKPVPELKHVFPPAEESVQRAKVWVIQGFQFQSQPWSACLPMGISLPFIDVLGPVLVSVRPTARGGGPVMRAPVPAEGTQGPSWAPHLGSVTHSPTALLVSASRLNHKAEPGPQVSFPVFNVFLVKPKI